MNYHHGRPGGTVTKTTVFILKWILMALLSLTIGLATMPASANIVQRDEATLRHHGRIHDLEAGPTSSPFTKAMKALLHHLPARRSDRVNQDNIRTLTLEPDEKEKEDYLEASDEIVSYYQKMKSLKSFTKRGCDYPPGLLNWRCSCPKGTERIRRKRVAQKIVLYGFGPSDPSVNLTDYQSSGSRVKDGAASNRIVKHHETSHDVISHNDTSSLCSTIECFCKLCRRASNRARVTCNSRKGILDETVSSARYGKPSDPSVLGSKIEIHEHKGLDGASKRCKCGPYNRKCWSQISKGPLLQQSQVKRETEDVAIDVMSHLKPSEPSPELADHHSNGKEVKGGPLDGSSRHENSTTDLKTSVKHNRRVPTSCSRHSQCSSYHQECRCSNTKLAQEGNQSRIQKMNIQSISQPASFSKSSKLSNSSHGHHSQSTTGQINSKPSTSFGSSEPSEIEAGHQLQSTNGQIKSKSLSISSPQESWPACRAMKHNIAVQSKKADAQDGIHSTSEKGNGKDDLGRLKRDLTSNPITCRCNGASPDCDFLQLVHLQASKKRHSAQSHCDNGSDCGIQRPHIVIHEGERDLTTDLAKLFGGEAEECRDFENFEHDVNEQALCEPLSGSLDARASHNTHLDPPSGDSIITPKQDITAQLWSEICSLRRWNCRPRPVHTSKIGAVIEVHNGNFNTSGHNGENIIQCKQQADGMFLSPPDSLIARDYTCYKPWPVNAYCRPNHRVKLGAETEHHHRFPRRSNTLLESVTDVRCHDKIGRAREECEEKNKIGFWIVCSLLAVAGICGLLLGILILRINLRRKRPSPLLISSRPGYKSGVSTLAPSGSEIQICKATKPASVMRQIDEEDVENSSVRRYTTLDGANDGWTSWIHKKTGRAQVSQNETIRFTHLSSPVSSNKLMNHVRYPDKAGFPQHR
jgi:hypothetical protein